MAIKSFLAIILIISPLFRASWDLWAQTAIHLLTLLVLLILLFRKEISVPLSLRPSVPLSLFLLFCFISIFGSANFYESRNEFFNILNYVVIFYFAKNVNKKTILIPILISGAMLSFYGFYQKIFTGGNIPSFMVNPNIFAGYLTGVICLTFGFLINDTTEQQDNPLQAEDSKTGTLNLLRKISEIPILNHRKIYFLMLVIFIIALFFTGSIAAWLAVIFGVFVFYYLNKEKISKKYIFSALAMFLILTVIKLFETDSFNRILWWLAAGKMILVKPFAGVGLGGFEDIYPKYKLSGLNSIYAHNYFLQMAAEIGIFGFLALMLFFIKISKQGKTKDALPFFAAAAAMLFHGIFDYSLLIPANAVLLWTFLGFCSKDVHLLKKDEKKITVSFTHNRKIIFNPKFAIEHLLRGETSYKKVYANLWVYLAGQVKFLTRFNLATLRADFAKAKSGLKWIAIPIIFGGMYFSLRLFLGSRETAQGKYYLDEKKYDIAQIHLKKSLQYDRYNPQTYFHLSNIYQQYFKITGYQTYLDEAEIELKNAMKLQKYNSQIYFDLYNINYLRGDTKDALNWLKKTRETSPKSISYEKCYQVFLKEIYKQDK